MTHRKAAVWTERLVLALILASLGGTLNLVLAIHRRVQSTTTTQKRPESAPLETQNATIVQEAPSPAPARPPAAPAPSPPAEDPTAPILARIDLAIAREASAAREADRRAAALEKARQSSVAESQRWKRREMLVHQQVAALGERADRLERDAVTLDAERDVLARERDALKAAMVESSQRSGYAVLPYKGPNGTWRRPIVLECVGNTVKLRPKGPTFSPLDLSPLIHPRSSPVILAIAREMLQIQRGETPDGAPAVPYLVFLVRPDGIRSYYLARSRLEPLGIAFGYELIEQDLAVDIPDFGDVRTWDGTVPIEIAGGGATSRAAWPPAGSSRDQARDGSASPNGDGATTGNPSPTGTWPPPVDPPSPPGSSRPWPALARGDGPARGAGGGAGATATGGGSDATPAPEIDLGGNSRQGARQPGGSRDGSPDDFVWPNTAGSGRPFGGGGNGSGMPTGSGGGPSPASGAAGMTPRGPIGGGLGLAPDPSPPGGGSLPGSSGGADLAPGGNAGGLLAGSGEPAGGSGPGSSFSGPGETGQATISSPGSAAPRGGTSAVGGSFAGGTRTGGASRAGGTTTGGGAYTGGTRTGGGASGTGTNPVSGASGTGTNPAGGTKPGGPKAAAAGGGNAGSLPDLEPVGDGTPATGTPMPNGGGHVGAGSPSSAATGVNGGSGPLDATAQGRPGSTPPTGGSAGSTATDPGFSPFSSRGGTAGQGGPGSGSMSGGSNTSPAANALGSPATSGPDSSGATGAAPGTGGDSPPASSSTSIAGLPASASTNFPSSTASGSPSTSTVGTGSMTGSTSSSSASQTPPALASLFNGGSTPSASSLADAMGGLPGAPSNSSSTSMGGASGSMSDSSSPSSSGAGGASGPQSSAVAPGMSLPSFNAGPDADPDSDFLKSLDLPPIDTHRQPGAIDVPFEIVVVCRRDDVLLHPGGYRITTQSLRSGAGKGANGETLLQRELKAIVLRRAQVDPMIRPKPRLKFLVETGGSPTFWTARKQLTFSSLDWPMTVQVAGPQPGYLLDERMR